jgi:hypothetical protein
VGNRGSCLHCMPMKCACSVRRFAVVAARDALGFERNRMLGALARQNRPLTANDQMKCLRAREAEPTGCSCICSRLSWRVCRNSTTFAMSGIQDDVVDAMGIVCAMQRPGGIGQELPRKLGRIASASRDANGSINAPAGWFGRDLSGSISLSLVGESTTFGVFRDCVSG